MGRSKTEQKKHGAVKTAAALAVTLAATSCAGCEPKPKMMWGQAKWDEAAWASSADGGVK